MRYSILLLLLAASPGFSQERYVERTPRMREPQEHTIQQSGDSRSVAPWAGPGVTRFDTGGYIGGDTTSGTFGTDFGGFGRHSGRVFRGSSADPSAGQSAARGYRTEGRRLPDVLALRPFRRAILAKKAALAP